MQKSTHIRLKLLVLFLLLGLVRLNLLCSLAPSILELLDSVYRQLDLGGMTRLTLSGLLDDLGGLLFGFEEGLNTLRICSLVSGYHGKGKSHHCDMCFRKDERGMQR